MDILPTAGRPNTRTGTHFTVRPANSLSYSEAWRPLRTSRYQREDEESRDGSRDRSGVKTESRLLYQSRTCGLVKGQSLESEKMPITQEKTFEHDQMRNSGRHGRPEWRRYNLSSRSKSLDWRTGGKSPERPQSFRGDILSRTGDKSEDGSRVMSTIHAYNAVNKTQNDPDTSLSKAKGQSLPTRYTPASLGPKGGQSILERIEKLYGSVEFGNSEDYKTTEHYKGSFSGTFPRRFSSGEHIQSPGQSRDSLSWTKSKDSLPSTSAGLNWTRTLGRWQSNDNSSHVEGGTFQSRGFSDIGTRSLDRARSRSTLASKIRAARAAEEMDKPAPVSTFLTGISEVSATASGGETSKMEDIARKNWSRTTIKERNSVKTESREDDKYAHLWMKKEAPSDDVFESQKFQLKSSEKYNAAKPAARSAASVRNKINQFEALTQRGQASFPRRAFSVPEHLSTSYNGVQRSSSAKDLGTYKWGGLKEEQAEVRGATDIETFKSPSKGEKKQDQDITTKKEVDVTTFYEDESKRTKVMDKESLNAKDSKDFNDYFKTKQDLPINKYSPPTTNVIHLDETDFSKSPMKLRDDETGFSKRPMKLRDDETDFSKRPMKLRDGETDFSKRPVKLRDDETGFSKSPIKLRDDETDFSKSPMKLRDDETDFSKRPMKLRDDETDFSKRPTKLRDDETDFSKSPIKLRDDETDFSKRPMKLRDDETDFSKSPMKLRDDGSGMSTPTSSDNDETPTNTPGTSPHLSPIEPPQKTPPLTSNSLDNSPPLTSDQPDLIFKDDLNGKKRILDLNAWLDGLNPQVKVWEDDGDEDDDSTQKDEDSNYDSDSGESSVTVTSVMSNKSFSVSLADLCNFAGVDSDSENDSDEWQSAGRRSASLSSDVSGFSCVSVMPAEELDKLIQDVKSIGDDNLQDYEDVHVVVLHKEIGVGLGFSLAGGVDQNKPVTVHKVFHSGVAAQEGSIKAGDQVLSLNGTALRGCAHWEALRVLRRTKGREMGVVVLKKPDVRAMSNGRALAVAHDPTPAQVNEAGRRITVSLEKSDRDLGFSLEGGVGSSLGNKPLTVQKIFQGGPFEKVLPGDELLEVNGVNVVGLRRLEAWTLIRKLPPGPVNVVLLRNPAPHKT